MNKHNNPLKILQSSMASLMRSLTQARCPPIMRLWNMIMCVTSHTNQPTKSRYGESQCNEEWYINYKKFEWVAFCFVSFCMTKLAELLDTSLGVIESSVQMNFMVDIGWLLGHYYFAGCLWVRAVCFQVWVYMLAWTDCLIAFGCVEYNIKFIISCKKTLKCIHLSEIIIFPNIISDYNNSFLDFEVYSKIL